MKTVKFIWTFLVELPAFLGGCVLITNGFIFTFLRIKNNKYLLYLFIFFVIFFLYYVIKNLKKFFTEFNNKRKSLEIKNEIIKISKQKNSSFEKRIPNHKLVKKLGDESIKKGKTWSEDATLESFNLYIDINTNKSIGIRSQAYFVSEWKDAVLVLYEGSSNSHDLKELSSSHFLYKTKDFLKPFYENFPKWREAVMKSLEAISDSVHENVEMSIHSHKDSMSITYSFNDGKIRKQRKFKFDGKQLKNEHTEKLIAI